MNIILAEPWTYRNTMMTVDYPAGTHEVSDEIHAAAMSASVHKEESDGNRSPADRPPRAARPPKG